MSASDARGAFPIAYGFWRYGPDDLALAIEMIGAAREAGISHFDTADVYGGRGHFGAAEALLGEARRRAPSLLGGVEIATKVGVERGTPYNSSKEYIIRAVDASLRRLGAERVDLLYVHRPDLLAHPAEVAEALDALVAGGKAARVGVSNYAPAQIEALRGFLKTPLAAHQIELSALATAPFFDGTLDQAMAWDMSVYAWSPLGGGRLFDPADGRAARVRTALEKHAKAAGCAVGAMALAFLMRHPARPTPIIGTRSVTRLREAVAAARVRLDRGAWYEILQASLGERLP
ncbi:aldo/keto reductase [Amphiplicatus metriothermophilus]|uniref:Predicted oxidoreductase n=1 Tax=Amphiplicatus metriothermophilus TaxID=1519374 RepID=A0A239PXJ0_9PROT|nr:aldo/keto reductase [Amphiplicatus metriothermophilus]MBB5519991.1 putative oxidoreductase [Amphiplicatus metriothermophilus]SNT74890.1 Predicted oxidoreductase [Amphiplicatus metriothermophilus]